MRSWICWVLVCLVGPLAHLSAQEPPAVRPGQRVRVTHHCGAASGQVTAQTHAKCRGDEGAVVAVTADTLALWIGDAGGTELSLPIRSVNRLQLYMGQRSNTHKGAFVGLAVAGGLGMIAGWGMCEISDQGCGGAGDHILGSLAGGVGMGLLGAGCGAIIGMLFSGDRWEEAPLDQLRVSFAPQQNGFGVGVRVAF